jgi:hypothetical protein
MSFSHKLSGSCDLGGGQKCLENHIFNEALGKCVEKKSGVGAIMNRHANSNVPTKAISEKLPIYADEAMHSKLREIEQNVLKLITIPERVLSETQSI